MAFNSLKYISRLLLKDLETKKYTCKTLVSYFLKFNSFLE